jgi:N-acyl-D-aspartate/D-glutamate deacylase
MKADLNVIDYENLKLEELKVVNDLSAGGARIRQGASGYLATLIDGVDTVKRRRYRCPSWPTAQKLILPEMW